MVTRFLGCSAAAAAALMIGALPVGAQDTTKMCGGVVDASGEMVMSGSGNAVLQSSSTPCPEVETVAVAEPAPDAASDDVVEAAPDESAEAPDAAATAANAGPLPHDGTVYFALNSAELEAEEYAALEDIAADLASRNPSSVIVRGYTDRTGPEAYNMMLSEQRAEAVASELTKAGIPQSAISTMAKGETELAVPTEDGVAMRQNRRTAIVAGL